MMDDQTVICRCEDVTIGEIRNAIEMGFTTVDEIKRLLRCGMGPCQGRTCLPVIAQQLARATHADVSDIALPTVRPPLKPLKMKMLAHHG